MWRAICISFHNMPETVSPAKWHRQWSFWTSTCSGVLVLLALCPGLRSLPVVVAAALVQPCVHAGAAVAQLALPATDDRVRGVDLLRALKAFLPGALGVLPAVAELPTGLHVFNDQEENHQRGDGHRETTSPHSGPESPAFWKIQGKILIPCFGPVEGGDVSGRCEERARGDDVRQLQTSQTLSFVRGILCVN